MCLFLIATAEKVCGQTKISPANIGCRWYPSQGVTYLGIQVTVNSAVVTTNILQCSSDLRVWKDLPTGLVTTAGLGPESFCYCFQPTNRIYFRVKTL